MHNPEEPQSNTAPSTKFPFNLSVRPILVVAVLFLIAVLSIILPETSGVSFHLSIAGIVIGFLYLLSRSLLAFGLKNNQLHWLKGLTVVVASFLIAFTFGEVLLERHFLKRTGFEAFNVIECLYSPEKCAKKVVRKSNTITFFYWHGKLHIKNEIGFRRVVPVPSKQEGVFRIAAIGDSLTYGYGVYEDEAWPSVLARDLGKTYHTEVLNLDVPGYSSEDLVSLLPKVLDEYDPDLVVYGMSLNDFLVITDLGEDV